MSRTLVRAYLTVIIKNVAETETDIVILDGTGEELAVLSTVPPKVVKPAKEKVATAKQIWSDMIALVCFRNACYVFSVPASSRPVYLYRSPHYENRTLEMWELHLVKLKEATKSK